MGRILLSFFASLELVSICNPVGVLVKFSSVVWGSLEPARWSLTFSVNVKWSIPAPSINSSKERGLTDFWRFIARELVMSWIYYTMVMFCGWTRYADAVASALYRSYLSLYFTRKISSRNLKFTIPKYIIMHKYTILDLSGLLCVTEIL